MNNKEKFLLQCALADLQGPLEVHLRDVDYAESVEKALRDGAEMNDDLIGLVPAESPFELPPKASVAPKLTSPEFKRWFGDSKVVDANGNPLVVYHGTTDDIATFNFDVDRNRMEGFYFSSSTDTAGGFAGSGKGANIIPVFLRLQNPLMVDAAGSYWYDMKISNEQPYQSLDDIANNALADGYDGVIVKNVRESEEKVPSDTYVAFRPDQIKSVLTEN